MLPASPGSRYLRAPHASLVQSATRSATATDTRWCETSCSRCPVRALEPGTDEHTCARTHRRPNPSFLLMELTTNNARVCACARVRALERACA
eukprot:3170163-Pleurochrysis_carterae.AAC.4